MSLNYTVVTFLYRLSKNYCMPSLKEKYKEAGRYIKKKLRDTAIEVLIGGAALSPVGAWTAHTFESNRDKLFPLAFSEISQIKDEAKKHEREIDPFTLYYAGLNDLVMKGLEAWNDGWKYSNTNAEGFIKFAERLDRTMTEHDYRHNLADLIISVQSDARSAYTQLAPFVEAQNHISGVNNHLSQAWQATHTDNYHPELRTRTVSHTDANGHTSYSTEFYTEQVYDDTTHTYNYSRPNGEIASINLDRILSEFGTLSVAITIQSASTVQQSNRNAIRSSRRSEHEFSDVEYLAFATTWKFGSNAQIHRTVFISPWATLRGDAGLWRSAKNTSRDHRYKTTRHNDDGPMEFQIVQKTLVHGQHFTQAVDAVANHIRYTQEQLPTVEDQIKKYVGHMLYPSDSPPLTTDTKTAAYLLRNSLIGLYSENFDMKRYRQGAVFLSGVLGLLAGAGLGFGVDTLTRRLHAPDSFRSHERYQY